MPLMRNPTVEVIFTVPTPEEVWSRRPVRHLEVFTEWDLFSVVNAPLAWPEVEITRDGAVYKQRFEDGWKTSYNPREDDRPCSQAPRQTKAFMPRSKLHLFQRQI